MTYQQNSNSNYEEILAQKLLGLGEVAERVNRKAEAIEKVSQITDEILRLEFII